MLVSVPSEGRFGLCLGKRISAIQETNLGGKKHHQLLCKPTEQPNHLLVFHTEGSYLETHMAHEPLKTP